MQKMIVFLLNVVFFVSLYAEKQTEPSMRERLRVQFNSEHALIFLQEGQRVIAQDRSMLRAFLMQTDDPQKGFYQMQPAGFDFLVRDQQFNHMKQTIESLLNTYIKTLETTEESSSEYQHVIQGIFEAIIFLIAHVRWNICEIEYDAYRSNIGYYQKIDETILNTYAIGQANHENISYSVYNKGKFSLLCPDDIELASLVHYVQYEELSRYQQLYTAFQAYVMHYYRIFGENEYTVTFLQNLVKLVENQFQEHSKRFTLDHIVRFSNNASIGRLLY